MYVFEELLMLIATASADVPAKIGISDRRQPYDLMDEFQICDYYAIIRRFVVGLKLYLHLMRPQGMLSPLSTHNLTLVKRQSGRRFL